MSSLNEDSPSRPISIVLADDHAIVRQGLKFYLDMQPDMIVVGEAANGREALEQVRLLHPDIVLMDLMMPVLNGIDATRQLLQEEPELKVIVLTTFADKDYMIPAIQSGVKGYLLKDTDPSELADAIRNVYAGKPELHPLVTEQLISHVVSDAKAEREQPERLTEREKEVLRYIARGYSNKEIAAACGIAEKTVKTHVSNLLSKLGFSDRTQAAVYAVKNGYTES